MDDDNEKSLADLKRETERSRAELAGTVEQLRSGVSDTVTDFRERASPDALKAEIGDYFRTRADALMDRARDNPLQTAAIGIGVGYPLLKIARSIPAPILMVGAGLYLLGTTSGQSSLRRFQRRFPPSRMLRPIASALVCGCREPESPGRPGFGRGGEGHDRVGRRECDAKSSGFWFGS